MFMKSFNRSGHYVLGFPQFRSPLGVNLFGKGVQAYTLLSNVFFL